MRQLELIDRGIKDLSFEFLNQDGDEALRDALSVSRILAGALNVLNARGAVPPVVAVPPAEGEGGTNGNA
jgi:hypothetical protein